MLIFTNQRILFRITILLIFLPKLMLAQSFDSMATKYWGKTSDRLNYIDENGLKQGLWKHYSLHFNTFCSGLSTEKSDTCIYLHSSGNYLNNQKTGIWEYYKDGGCYKYTLRTEQYHSDGSVTINDLESHSSLTYSGDSGVVSGYVLLNQDTVIITCSKANNLCFAWVDGQKLQEFSFNHLSLEINRINSGYYQRAIQRLKTRKTSKK